MGKWGYAGHGVSYAKTMGMRPMRFKRVRRPVPYKKNIYRGAPRQSGRSRTDLRSGRSYTITKTQKKKRRNGTVSKTGENTSSSYTSHSNKWSKVPGTLFKKLLGRQTFQTNVSGTRTSKYGRQDELSQSSINLSNLEYMAAQANGGTVTAENVKIFMGSVKTKYHFRNQSNDAGVMLIYDLTCKRTPPDSNFDTPREVWQKGLIDLGNDTLQWETVGQIPTTSPEFKRYFSISKVTRVPMEAGQMHEHTTMQRVNKVVESVRWQNTTSVSHSGLTNWCMVIYRGGICHESATNANVTFSPMKLDYIKDVTFDFAYMPINKAKYLSVDTLAVAITDPDFMGENQDYDANNITA